jgi:hypothetical protein
MGSSLSLSLNGIRRYRGERHEHCQYREESLRVLQVR